MSEPRLIVDLSPSPLFRKNHIPGAVFAIRSDLISLPAVANAQQLILTSPDGVTAHFAAAELSQYGISASVIAGGNEAWKQAGLTFEVGLDESSALSPPEDVYKRPYEGTDNAASAMQAYLDWEYGLVEQLGRDATHGFNVLEQA